jgi:uncharacterized ferritin-like protein (DUF455 family)
MQIQSPDSRAALMVNDAAHTLKRYCLLQRELVLMQAGWLPGTANMDIKLALAESLWQDALIAKELRQRVLELRFPERLIAPDADEALINWWRTFRDAPAGEAFAIGLHEVLKPALREAFQAYLDLSDPLDDAPTRRILQHALQDIDEQAARWHSLLTDVRRTPAVLKWLSDLQIARAAAGADLLIGAPRSVYPAIESRTPFQIARYAVRDPRYPQLKFAWPDRIDPARGPGEGLQLQVRSAVHHANEIWATEMAAAVLFDLADRAPHEFLDDAARWCFDESRHCRMGLARFKSFGYSIDQIPLDTFSYDAGATLDAVTRLGIIFYFETTYIHTKPQRAKIFYEAGDRLSSHDMDYDWADEQIHTHYGSHWLKYFLELEGDTRTPLQIRDAAEASVWQIRATLTPEDEAATQALFERTMAQAQQLAQH